MAKEIDAHKSFDGYQKRFEHASKACSCDMTFSVFFPPAAEKGKVPVIYYLPGLTCTDETFPQKGSAQRKAAELGVALVSTDTSPRGLNIPGEEEEWDLGTGASFYVNATTDKWKKYRMYDYITKELPSVLAESFPDKLDTQNASIMGHSMGGHGALVIGLRNPTKYKSISALAPIAHPIDSPWGQKAFPAYLGHDKEQWKLYDATELAKQYDGPKTGPILIDQGDSDQFLNNQLKPWAFEEAAKKNGRIEVILRLEPGYDHSYYTISTFSADHVEHHFKALKGQ